MHTDAAMADPRVRLINILTLVAAPGSLIVFATMFVAEAPNYMRGLYLFPLLLIIAHPSLLPFKARTFALAFIFVTAGVMVSEGRMEPIGGRLYVIFSATICAVLLSIRTGIYVLLAGSFALFTPYIFYKYGYYPDLEPSAVKPLRDWIVQAVTGLLPGLLFLLSFGFAFKWLSVSEEKYRLVTDHAIDIIWEMNADQIITFVTPSVKTILGFEVRELIGREGKELTGQVGYDRMRQLLSTGVPHEITEIEVKSKTGESVWVESRSDIVRNEQGEISGLTGIFRDVTARRIERERGLILEEQLRQSQKMDSIGQFAGGIAHDFNNLLGVILGFAEIIKTDNLQSDDLEECIDEISDAGNRASALTQQILLFSRKQTTQFLPVDCNSILENLETMLNRLLPENISLKINMAENIDPISANANQIEQVIMNLIVNAKDAIPKGGCILIETENINIDESFAETNIWATVGDFIRLSVIDSGTGISEEIQSRMFEPFYTSKEQGKGTGLGLSVIYGIMQQHDGFINVYSKEGSGTEFQLFFPITNMVVKDISKPLEIVIVGGNETILVIEDDPILRKVAQRMLSSAGYTILTAESGEQAIEIFSKNQDRIALVFSDIMLPGMNGWELIENINNKNRGAKFLLASGYTTSEIEKGVYETTVIPKPYNSSTLLRAVRHTLS